MSADPGEVSDVSVHNYFGGLHFLDELNEGSMHQGWGPIPIVSVGSDKNDPVFDRALESSGVFNGLELRAFFNVGGVDVPPQFSLQGVSTLVNAPRQLAGNPLYSTGPFCLENSDEFFCRN